MESYVSEMARRISEDVGHRPMSKSSETSPPATSLDLRMHVEECRDPRYSVIQENLSALGIHLTNAQHDVKEYIENGGKLPDTTIELLIERGLMAPPRSLTPNPEQVNPPTSGYSPK